MNKQTFFLLAAVVTVLALSSLACVIEDFTADLTSVTLTVAEAEYQDEIRARSVTLTREAGGQ